MLTSVVESRTANVLFLAKAVGGVQDVPINVHEHDNFVEFVGTGDLAADEIVSASVMYHGNTPKKLALWNLLGARISSFRAVNFQKVATKGAELASLRGPGARNAIVVSNQAERQLLQAYSNMASAVSPVQHEIFFGLDEAIAWLRGGNDGSQTDGSNQD